jgi:hypothetical protein
MKRAFVVVVVLALSLIGLAGGALADPHPSQGVNSTGRNPNGSGAVHCHVLIDNNTPFDSALVYPSHKAHLASGIGHVFNGDTDCDGAAG